MKGSPRIRWATGRTREIAKYVRPTKEGCYAAAFGLMAQFLVARSSGYEGLKETLVLTATLLGGGLLLYVRLIPWTVFLLNLALVGFMSRYGVHVSADLLLAQFFLCLVLGLASATLGTLACFGTLLLIDYRAGGFVNLTSVVGVGQDPLIALAAGRGLRAHVKARLRSEHRGLQAELTARDDRLHVAQEMHDVLNHSVSVISLQAGGALSVIDSDQQAARTALQNISAIAAQSAGELRQTVHRLKSPGWSSPSGNHHGLDDLPALVELARSSRPGIVLTQGPATWQPSPDHQQVVYRFVQEGLTNAFRHGKPNSRIQIELRWGADDLLVEVENEVDAAPERSPGGSYGLTGLGQRISALNGTFEVVTARGRFLIRMTLNAPSRWPVDLRDPARRPR